MLLIPALLAWYVAVDTKGSFQMPTPPTGTVTFLFTDIEGSTKRWEQNAASMKEALQRHDGLLRSAIEANGGYIFKTVGDAFCAAFPTAVDALHTCLTSQSALQAESWGETEPVRIRAGLHTGMAQEQDGDYFGPALNRVARLMSAGHGGQTLLSLPTYELLRDHLPEGVTLQDMGEHRLKDLYRPEHIFQVLAPGPPWELASEFPPLTTLDNRPNNLPVQPTPMIGREADTAVVSALLSRDDVRLVTLTGPGGTGKTRLGLQVAADMLDRFPDGVWFVDLAPIIDTDLVMSTVAQVLGVKEAPGQPLVDTLNAYLKAKHLLLLLDNFEQVAAAAKQLSQLLAACPRLKVLTTSRVALHLRGEREFHVPALSLPDPERLPSIEKLAEYEAVRLFIERAVDVKPDFQVTNENAPAVAEICARLDGLPLALELAAARVRLLPPQAMLSKLQSRLKLLTGGARDLPARQQTLRGAIEWSYDLLDAREKQLFRRLAVFVGGRSLEAIEAVCSSEADAEMDVLDGVQSLVDKNLLKQQEGVQGRPRFVMLETIHEFAREKLKESGEEEDLREWHAGYFLRLAEEAQPHFTGPLQVEWLDRVEEEQDNFRAAIQWAEQMQDAELALSIPVALGWFWRRRGYITEGRQYLEMALQLTDNTLPGAESGEDQLRRCGSARVMAYRWLSGFNWLEENLDAATDVMNKGLQLARELGDEMGVGRSLLELGRAAYRRGDYTTARSDVEEALTYFRRLGARADLADALLVLGNLWERDEELEKSRSLFEESLAIRRQLGHKAGVAVVLANLAGIFMVQHDYSQARLFSEEALQLLIEVGDRVQTAGLLYGLGWVALHQGDAREATEFFVNSMKVAIQYGLARWIHLSIAGLGGVAAESNKALRAARLLGAAEALHAGIGAGWDSDDRAEFDNSVDSAHSQLGDTEWEIALHEGRAMTMEQAIAYALEEDLTL